MLKKWFGLCILLCALGFILLGCTPEYPPAPLEHKELLFDQTLRERYEEPGIQTLIEQGEQYTLAVHYPLTEMPMINEHIKQFVDQRIQVFHNARTLNAASALDDTLFELHLFYQVAHHSDRHYAIVFTERVITGLDLLETRSYAFTYNTQSEKRLLLKDLFLSNDAVDILYELTLDALYEQLDEITEEAFEPLESNFSQFLLTDDALVFWFGPDQWLTDSQLPLRVAIPYETLTQYLTLLEDVLPSRPLNMAAQVAPELESTNEENQSVTQELEGDKKKVAITFESGPHPLYTPIILDTLTTRDTKATFFFLGNRSLAYPEVVAKTHLEGHLIGNHTFTHPQMTRLSPSQMSEEIRSTQNAIYASTGFKPYMLRPPFGLFDASLIQTANMPLILWSIDPGDDVYQDPQYIISHVLANVHDGAIIRLRDNNSGTTQAIGGLIDALLNEGYECVTLSELLNIHEDNAPKLLRTYSQK